MVAATVLEAVAVMACEFESRLTHHFYFLMKTKTYSVTYYEPGDKLQNIMTGKIYTFVEYGPFNTTAIKDRKGTHTVGRNIVDDPKCFRFVK